MNEPPGALDPLAECTSVLMTVPFEIARRLESFLRANDVACRIRRTTLTPEQLAEEALRSASPQAAKLLDSGVGRRFSVKLRRELKAEIELHASGLTEQYDVLVRPADLPADAQVTEEAAAPAAGPPPADAQPDPWARPSEGSGAGGVEPTGEVDRVAAAGAAGAPAAGGPGAVELCQLPWDQAWALVERLAAAGIAAAVLEPETVARDVPMSERMVPVGVQAGDLERALGFVQG